MGTVAQLLRVAPGSSVIVMQVFVVLSLAASTFGLPSAQYAGYGDIGPPGYGPGLGHGVIHHKDPCEEGTETIMVKKCRGARTLTRDMEGDPPSLVSEAPPDLGTA